MSTPDLDKYNSLAECLTDMPEQKFTRTDSFISLPDVKSEDDGVTVDIANMTVLYAGSDGAVIKVYTYLQTVEDIEEKDTVYLMENPITDFELLCLNNGLNPDQVAEIDDESSIEADFGDFSTDGAPYVVSPEHDDPFGAPITRTKNILHKDDTGKLIEVNTAWNHPVAGVTKGSPDTKRYYYLELPKQGIDDIAISVRTSLREALEV